MTETEIFLDPSEDILRVFLRRPNESWGFSKLRKSDFARQMKDNSGISMLRLRHLENSDEALNWFKSRKLKGLAHCKAEKLMELGVHFIANSTTAKHISVRCSPCNLCVDYPVLCQPQSGQSCLLDLEARDSFSQEFYKLFVIYTPISVNQIEPE